MNIFLACIYKKNCSYLQVCLEYQFYLTCSYKKNYKDFGASEKGSQVQVNMENSYRKSNFHPSGQITSVELRESQCETLKAFLNYFPQNFSNKFI